MPPATAPQEVSGAIFAGTVTTLAVFLPAVFLTGMIKYLFDAAVVGRDVHDRRLVRPGADGRARVLSRRSSANA